MPVPAKKTPEAPKLPPPTNTADLVRRYRHAARMSQAQLAHLSGRSVTVISQIERGMRCTPDTAERLSAILGCSAAELLR